ncbi:MAG: aminopeptidase P family protein, partial [Dysgonamonadaceae bacterium]|nr:aminopeptidase P family protein [Dysgonamonadaceae bacterium]
SEYTPAHWKTREWISGFTGSAGTIVITAGQAGLWTDSRYFLQATEQLQDSGIDLFKMGMPGTPTSREWLAGQLSTGDCIGIEGAVFPASEVLDWIRFFEKHQIHIRTDFAPYNILWKNRPEIPKHPVYLLPETLTGLSAQAKIEQTRLAMREKGANLTIIATLDTVAWLFNLRGNDVEYNPTAVCYAIISENEAVLFISSEKITKEVSDNLQKQGIQIADYSTIVDYVRQKTTSAETSLLITPAKLNYQLYEAINPQTACIETDVHPADQLKSIKNETEIAGIRQAMQRDGVALVKFHRWLENALAAGETVTELDISTKLREYRSEQKQYAGESFETIAGYAEHGAIVHYGATQESNAVIQPQGILLIDSGAQYLDGTTDITRTIAAGPVSDAMKTDYTHVLKGHIALASARFPKGTKGIQLDVLARQFLWKNGTNYLHGTGHGVGHFLNVHEGPQSIRMEHNPTELQPGMVTSNEPGLYRAGAYGIRIENLLLTVPDQTTKFGEFYAFETLTLCPIDTKLIDTKLLNPEEKDWLNHYHQKVYQLLSPFLSIEENSWLKQATALVE